MDMQEISKTPDTTAQYDQADVQNNKVMAVLSYFGILWLVPLLGAKNSKFAQFHANQGLVLCLFEIAYGIVVRVINAIVGSIPVVGLIVGLVLSLLYLVWLVLAILGIVNACQGKAKDLPIIGGIRIVK